MIVAREIAFGSPEYRQELELRYQVLRKPLGYDKTKDLSDTEEIDLHLGAFDGDRLVGVLMLIDLGGGEVKMRQVAVDPSRQRSGIGRLLVQEAERLAVEKGFREINLWARKTAVPFYLALGYETVSEEFMEIGIPHLKMRKLL